MFRILFLSLSIFFFFINCSSTSSQNSQISKDLAEFLKETHRDKRTTYMEINMLGNTLSGMVQSKEIGDEFVDFLSQKNNKSYKNDLQTIQKRRAIVRNSVSNVRSEPKHSAELATQYIMGQELNVIKTDGDWYYVQGPDQYLGWIDWGGILVDDWVDSTWDKAEKVKVQRNEASAFEQEVPSQPATDLVFGNLLAKSNDGNYILPDGTKVKVSPEVFVEQQGDSIQLILDKAMSLLGRPYLWGGTSTKAMDCSGFTRTAYMNAGYLLGRDASLQVHEGEEVDKDDIHQWKPGDLLFFGEIRDDGSQRITHVAIHLENGKIIHASGHVKIESLNPDDLKYNDYRASSLLRVKRIIN